MEQRARGRCLALDVRLRVLCACAVRCSMRSRRRVMDPMTGEAREPRGESLQRRRASSSPGPRSKSPRISEDSPSVDSSDSWHTAGTAGSAGRTPSREAARMRAEMHRRAGERLFAPQAQAGEPQLLPAPPQYTPLPPPPASLMRSGRQVERDEIRKQARQHRQASQPIPSAPAPSVEQFEISTPRVGSIDPGVPMLGGSDFAYLGNGGYLVSKRAMQEQTTLLKSFAKKRQHSAPVEPKREYSPPRKNAEVAEAQQDDEFDDASDGQPQPPLQRQ